jgi:steroid delta-isomerase
MSVKPEPSESAIRSTIADYVRAFAEKDRELWLRVFTPDAMQEDPIGSGQLLGYEQIGSFWDKAFAANQSIQLVPREIYVCGSEAAMVWSITARRHEGGSRRLSGVDVFSFDGDARIRAVRAFWQRNLVEKGD